MRSTRSASRVGHLRLANQHIVGSSFTEPLEAVRWMLAMQAQDLRSAKWAIGLRAPGSTERQVDAALAAGTIVRSWPLRGTLHVCAAEDLEWMLAVSAPRTIASAAPRRAGLGLDERTLERARAIVLARLAGAKLLTRDALLAELDAAKVSTKGQRGYHILAYLALTGTLCLGPMSGKEQTFVRLNEWVKCSRRLEHDEALGELALRYFTSHGPATLTDFTSWTKLIARDAKVALAVARPRLVEQVFEGTSHFMAADAEDTLAGATGVARSVVILPGFDEYILGYRDRSGVLAPEHSSRIVPGGNGIFLPTIVVDGHVVGTWRRVAKSKECLIEAVPFGRWSPTAAKGFAAAAQAHATFLGLSARAVVSSSTKL